LASYFSIDPELLNGAKLPFEVYINSSAAAKQHFICLFKSGAAISPQMVVEAKTRFYQLYLKEDDRSAYLSFISKNKSLPVQLRTQILKETAGLYLEPLVGTDWTKENPEYLARCVMQCRDLVENIIDVVESKTLEEIKFMLRDLSIHDFYTFDHSVNVCIYALRFYQQIYTKENRKKVIEMGLGALLHDIGKSKIDTAIINKPSELSVEEFKEIKEHTRLGREIFFSLMHKLPQDLNWHNIIDIIYQHHENVDGSGYPLGLKDKEINNMGKVCMIADIFDALTSKRSYSDVVSFERALELMKKMVGRKLDPDLFNKLLPQFEEMQTTKALPKDNLVLHPFFDPSVPYKHMELVVDCPVTGYDQTFKHDDYGRVIYVPGTEKKKVS